MKSRLTFAVSVMTVAGLTSACSTSERVADRKVASAYDVGVVGPDGNVLLYYPDGNEIVVRSCDLNTVLGSTTISARKNCKGPESRVPVETFKQHIRSLVFTDHGHQFKPLNHDDVKGYRSGALGSEELRDLEATLGKIENFIREYGAADANLPHRDELLKALSNHRTQRSAAKKVESQVEKVIDAIVNDAALTITKASRDKGTFMLTVLQAFDPATKHVCGLTGSVSQRINDCSITPESTRQGWQLVTRTRGYKEVWKQPGKNLIWGDMTDEVENWSYFVSYCEREALEINGSSIEGSTFRLPTLAEFQEATRAGFVEARPGFSRFFWTANEAREDSYSAYAYKPHENKVVAHPKRAAFYRATCVGDYEASRF